MPSALLALSLLLLAGAIARANEQPPPLLLDVGHTGGVTALAFSRDGSTLASSSHDGTVRLLEGRSGRVQAELRVAGDVFGVSFSPDGSRLATASTYNLVRLWDTRTRALTATFEGHRTWVKSVSFSRDGRLIASCDGELGVLLRDAASGAIRVELPAPGADRVFLGPDGKQVAAVGGGSFRLWEAPLTAPAQPPLTWPLDRAADVTWTERAARVATGGPGGKGIVVSDLRGKEEARLEPAASFATFAWSADGRHLAAGGWNGTVRIYTPGNGRMTLAIEADGRGAVTALAWSPDGARLAAGDDRGGITLWSLPGAVALADLPAQVFITTSPSWGPDNRLAVVGSAGMLWDAETGRIVATLGEAMSGLTSCGDILTGVTAQGHTLGWWDGRTGARLATSPTGPHAQHQLACSPDGATLATWGYGAQLWDTRHRLGRTIIGPERWVSQADWSPDGREIALAFERGVEMWRLDDGRVRRRLRSHLVSRAIAWRPDGRALLVDVDARRRFTTVDEKGRDKGSIGFPTGSVAELDPRTLARRSWVHTCMKGTMQPCHYDALAFSPDGSRLAAIIDHRLVVIDQRAGLALPDGALGIGRRAARDLCWSRDGRTLAVAGDEGLFLLRPETGAVLHLRAVRVAGRLRGLVEDGEGHFTGDDEACARVVTRSPDGTPLPPAEVQRSRRPDLLTRFLGLPATASP